MTDLRATSSDNDACKQLLLEASTFTTTGRKILRLLLLPLSTTLQATTVVGFWTWFELHGNNSTQKGRGSIASCIVADFKVKRFGEYKMFEKRRDCKAELIFTPTTRRRKLTAITTKLPTITTTTMTRTTTNLSNGKLNWATRLKAFEEFERNRI